MTEIQFKTVEIPALPTAGRAKAPNPFDGRFPTPDGKAIEFTLPDTAKDATEVRTLRRQAQAAANAADRTARFDVQAVANGKTRKTDAVVTIWTVSRVKRPRKGETTPETSSE